MKKKIIILMISAVFVLQIIINREVTNGSFFSLDMLEIASAQPIEYPPDSTPGAKSSYKDVIIQEEVGHNEYHVIYGQLLVYWVVDTPEVTERTPCCIPGTVYDACSSKVWCSEL